MHYSRQQLKQDKFAETAAGAVHWTTAHRDTIKRVGIPLLIILVVVGAGLWYRNYNSNQAADELGKAMLTFTSPVVSDVPAGTPVQTFKTDQERLIAAKNAFYAVSSKYGSTSAGRFSHYYAGLCELELANYKVAEDQLKAVAEGRDKEVGSLARFALASVYRNTNRQSDAVSAYKQLIASPTSSVPKTMAELELADVYTASDPTQARQLYQEVAKEDAKGAAGQIAQQRMASLK